MRSKTIKTTATSRWFSAWRNPADRPAQDDPADLGTAFGLDLSLHQQPDLTDDQLRALRAADAPPPAARAHRSSLRDDAPQPGWVQRLGVGRKPAV